MRRTAPHFSHFTSTSAALPDTPSSYIRSGPLHSVLPWWMKSSQGKSSKCPCLQAVKNRAGITVEDAPCVVQLWTYRALSGR